MESLIGTSFVVVCFDSVRGWSRKVSKVSLKLVIMIGNIIVIVIVTVIVSVIVCIQLG